MMSVIRQHARVAVIALVLLTGLAGAAVAQQRGVVRGTVRDAATSAPIAQAQVTVGGSTIGAVTDAEGRYRVGNLPAGRLEMRVRMIGYRVIQRVIAVPADGEAQEDFTLVASSLSLDEFVVTASGNTESARQLSSPPTVINFDNLDPTAHNSMSDALNSRAPGVVVQSSGGTTGAGTRIRFRGAGSLSLSNEPVLYIDGVRVDNNPNANSLGVGGQLPSRINDLDPEEIDNIELIHGPAAAALYGTDAANGIISVHTRRGQSGAPKWRAYVEGGSLREDTRWPANFFGFDSSKVNSLRFACTLQRVSLGQCVQQGSHAAAGAYYGTTASSDVFTLNPLMNDAPFRNGAHAQYGLSVSGGSERTTYFLSSDLTQEDGIYRNNGLTRVNLRANLNASLSPTLDVGVQSGYTNSGLSLPDNDNDALGYLGSGLLGVSDTTRRGWGFLLPEQVVLIQSKQAIDRFTGGATVDYRPFPWLTMHGVAGLDHSTRFDTRTFLPNQVPFNTTSLQGSRAADPIQIWDWNTKASAQARFNLTPSVSLQTTVGIDYFHARTESIFASGQKLAAGTSSLAGIGIPSASESYVEGKTFGVYGEEVVGLNNRIFITGSLRHDDNAAFGRNFNTVTYPKVGASWVMSEEGFFPHIPALTSFRVRGAYGILGLAPGPTDALQFFNPVAVTDQGGDQVAFTVGSLGNPNLKPEIVHETELGFDAGLLHDRLNANFTYYDKESHDALISRVLAPSLGVATSQFFNLGQVSNKGFEFSFSGRAFERRGIALDLAVSLWHNDNKLVKMGIYDSLGHPTPIIFGLGGGSQRHQEGYPLGGYWLKPIISVNDTAGCAACAVPRPTGTADGIITSSEVTLDTAFHFIGPVLPTKGWGFSPSLTIGQRLRISVTIDHRGGNYLYNSTASFRCGFNICPEVNDPTTPIARQAQAVSSVFKGQDNGYVEPADFTKLRELAVTYYAPASWARLMRASAVSFTLAGRNLHTWTSYTGVDPELNEAGQANFTTADFLTQPPVRSWNFRVNYTF